MRVVSNLVEGVGVNATTRLSGVAKNTVLKLLRDLGTACEECQREHVRDLTCQRIQCDEIWQFCYSKAKNVPEKYRGVFGFGDVWTWVGIDADTKLIVAWHIGTRDADAATVFILIDELELRYPAIKGRLRDESGALRRFVNLYVNGEDVRFQNGINTSLKSGDELSIVPAVAGGFF